MLLLLLLMLLLLMLLLLLVLLLLLLLLLLHKFLQLWYLPGGHLIHGPVLITREYMYPVVLQKVLNLPVCSFMLLILFSRYENAELTAESS